jgi:membrane protein
MKEKLKLVNNFFKRDIWHITPKDLSPGRFFLIRLLKIIFVSIRGFLEDKIQLRASALTYYSLLAIIPVLAMIFGIAKGFGLDGQIENILNSAFEGQEQIVEYLLSFTERMLDNTRGGVLAGVGVVILFWAVIKVLNQIEGSMNDIWQIKKHRTWIRKFTDYISMMLFAPLFVVLISSLNVYVVRYFEKATEIFSFLSLFGPIVLRFIPWVLIWTLFTLIYMIMPNTKVKFSSALFAGIVAGTLFQLLQWGFINLQIGVSKYNAIYGTFAALPIFVFLMQLSWIVVLFGSELAFANQNIENYEIENESLKISVNFKKQIALLILHTIIIRFKAGEKPFTSSAIAHELNIPIRLVRQILFDFTQSHLVMEVSADNTKEKFYMPAMDISRISVAMVYDRLDNLGDDNPIKPQESLTYKNIIQIHKNLILQQEKLAADKLIMDI